MKRIAVLLLLLAAVIGLVIVFGGGETASAAAPAAYLRVHIRANSNEETDQAVKYKVRDGVVEYLTPTIAGCESKQEALTAVTRQLPAIERVAERILSENGYSYGARARLTQENFPTRVYDGATLPRACTMPSFWNLVRERGTTGGASSIRRFALRAGI